MYAFHFGQMITSGVLVGLPDFWCAGDGSIVQGGLEEARDEERIVEGISYYQSASLIVGKMSENDEEERDSVSHAQDSLLFSAPAVALPFH